MASDLIENYEGHPAFQFFRDFDADCDWSEALQGEPGEYIVVVRRADDSFFLGAGTNDEPRTLTQKLGFLKSGMTYTQRSMPTLRILRRIPKTIASKTDRDFCPICSKLQ